MAQRHKKAHTPASANNTTCKRGYHYLTLDNTPIPEFSTHRLRDLQKVVKNPHKHTHTHTLSLSLSLSLSLHTLPVPAHLSFVHWTFPTATNDYVMPGPEYRTLI